METLAGSPEKLPYRFESLTGVRDADLLKARAVFAAGQGPLEMEMVFRIGVPTRLESGRYRWTRENRIEEGLISEVSATFLGGQSDRPSVGGVFLLHDQSGAPVARVIIPTTQVARW